MYRCVAVCIVGALVGGCLFGSTDATKAAMRVEAKATVARRSAIRAKDYPTILAYDDVFLARTGRADIKLRDARKRHFAAWLESEIAKLGPPSTSNLDALFGTLVAFRREAQREAGPQWVKDYRAKSSTSDPSVTLRSEDLGTVDASLIKPRLAELATAMWVTVDAAEKAGDLTGAVGRARAITSALPKDSPQVAVLAALEQRASATFLERARAAGDAHAGARVMYAKIARMLGATKEAVGGLATPTPELYAELGAAWEIAVDGDCGDSVTIDGVRSKLEPALRWAGWNTASTKDAPSLNIRFTASCSPTPRTWQTQEEIPYIDIREETSKEPIYDQQCMPNVYKEDRERQGDTLVTTKWIVPAECHDEIVGSEDVKHTIREPKTETVTVQHLTTSITASGKIEITIDGKKFEWELSVKGESTDDPAYRGTHVQAKARGDYTEMEARRATQDLIIAELDKRRREVFASRAAKTLEVATAATAAGKVLEADHAFYVSYAMLAGYRPSRPSNTLRGTNTPTTSGGATTTTTTSSTTTSGGQTTTTTTTTGGPGSGGPGLEMTKWVWATHKVPATALEEALLDRPLPTLDLVGARKIASIDLPITLENYDSLNDSTSGRETAQVISILVAAGPALTKTDTTSSTGGLATLQLAVNPEAYMFGFRMTGGGLAAGGGHGFFDFDFNVGYGAKARGLWIGPVLGLGGDFTTGSQDSTPTAEVFTVRPGLYFEYGARLLYAFPKNGKLELQYNKAFRSTTALAAEKRAEGRFFYHGLGTHLVLTVRYTEYLPDVDSFFGVFSKDGRLARSTWILGGFGF